MDATLERSEMDLGTANLPPPEFRCPQVIGTCIAISEAQPGYDEVTLRAEQSKYGLWTVYAWAATVGMLGIAHAIQTYSDYNLRAREHPNVPGRVPVIQKARAVCRYVIYRRFHPNIGLFSAGTFSFLVASAAFLVALVFARRPYYAQQVDAGPPPISIRTGLMAFACMPLLVALSGKANIITLLTGASHENLIVIHRWVAWAVFALSLAHTLPFFIQPYRYSFGDRPERIKLGFYRDAPRGGSQYSGVPPLAILFGICVASARPFRRLFPSVFYYSHIGLVTTFFGLLFWHSANIHNSWAYLWSTLAVWLSSWSARLLWFTRTLSVQSEPSHWLESSPATLTQLPNEAVRVAVWHPVNFKWAPGQHAFLRFQFSLLENRPATIATAPIPIEPSSRICFAPTEFIFRANDDFTRKVHQFAESGEDGTTKVYLDGPYGGIRRPLEYHFDNIVLVAGGSGISTCLPWLLYAIHQSRVSGSRLRLKRLALVWSVRDASSLSWIYDALENSFQPHLNDPSIRIDFRLHITGRSTCSPHGARDGNIIAVGAEGRAVEADDRSLNLTAGIHEKWHSSLQRQTVLQSAVFSRPSFPRMLDEHVLSGGKSIVIASGPGGLMVDLANAVANLQKRVFEGDCEEIALYLEKLGW